MEQKTELLPFVQQQLDTMPIKAEDLHALVKEYEGFTINGVEDREGIAKVYEARQVIKKKRIAVEKSAKSLRDVANSFNRSVSEREKELVAIIEPLEDKFKKMEDEIAIEKKRLRDEEDARQARIIQDKIDRLNAVGYAVDFVQLKGMTDEMFEEILVEATKAHAEKVEQERLAAIARQEEEKRKEEERQAEIKRLEEQRIQQEKERKELEYQLEEIRAEREKLEQEKQERDRLAREDQARIDADNRERERKIQEEQEKLKQEQAAIIQQKAQIRERRLKSLGMITDLNGWVYEEKGVNMLHSVGYALLASIDDDGFEGVYQQADKMISAIKSEHTRFKQQKEEEARQKAIKDEQDRLERERIEKEQAEAKRAEAERQALLASEDREKFNYLAKKMRDLNEEEVWHTFKSDSGKRRSESVREGLLQLIDIFENAAAEPKS